MTEQQREELLEGDPWRKQVGGDWYKRCAIQPLEYAKKNGLGIEEHMVIKYVTRHRFRSGRKDLEKAIHYLELLIEQEYPE